MRESFEHEGTATGEYKSGLYVTYCGREYPAVYLGVGRFILYSDVADENFTFPAQDGRYLLQTDLRDTSLTRASEIRMVGIMKEGYENVMIRDILEEGVVISTYNPRLAFELNLKPVKELGFTGLVDRSLLIGMYEERDYLWNPTLGIYATFCQAVNADCENTWFADKDRIMQVCVIENPGNEREEEAS
ncbi:MAG: hypothetical protein MR531_06065 [Lachnospiraceae bacterium]|nr:hypothetical protein [Lachnospiraceae bacterium]